MSESAAHHYTTRRGAAHREYERWWKRGRVFALIGAASVLYAGFTVVRALQRGAVNWPLFAATLASIAVFGALILDARGRSNAAMRRVALYDTALARARGDKPQSGHTGEAFADAGHIYARDLDVVGPHSLFGMLATTRTALGQEALADFLLHPAEAATARERQATVRELTDAYDLREQVAMLGRSEFEEVPAHAFTRWLRVKSVGYPAGLRPALGLLSMAWAVGLVIGFVTRVDVADLVRSTAAILAVQAALCLWFRMRVHVELDAAERLAGQIAVLRRGLQLLRAEDFISGRLVELQRQAEGSDRALAQLERLLTLAEQRTTEWFYFPALLLCVGTHAASGLERWKRNHADTMQRWLEVWGEFDALLALSTYAAEHPENVYAEIEKGESAAAMFHATGLKHPLLPREEAMPNDITLDAETQFLLISGSNMAGKSTLLRAVGANALLALTGVPVPAQSLRLRVTAIGASLAVGDSLAERKSKFLAEVERLRDIVTLAEANRGGTLFLLDEIFSGTNSLDRKAAAEAVLRSLVAAGAVGALSTHDLTLTGIAEQPEFRGRNVHMASAAEDDPLAFDYRLKPGINQMTNALAIVRMLGL